MKTKLIASNIKKMLKHIPKHEQEVATKMMILIAIAKDGK